jgi:PIN domain nuclease of toxin-antitoxin system
LILLDTHIFVWMNLQSREIPEKILSAIDEEDVLGLAAISLWEIAMLTRKGRIVLPQPLLSWFREVLQTPKLTVLPLTPEIAARSELLDMHGDPADRLIAATALEYDVPLATVDRLLLEFAPLKHI